MAKHSFISEIDANRINNDAGDNRIAIKVGEKWSVIPAMPDFYQTPDGRVVRANVRMHFNNCTGRGRLTPLSKEQYAEMLKPKSEPASKTATIGGSDLLSADLIVKLDELVSEGIELEEQSLKELATLAGVSRISTEQRTAYLNLPR